MLIRELLQRTFVPEGKYSVSPTGGVRECAEELVGVRVRKRLAAAEIRHMEWAATRHPRHFAQGHRAMALGQAVGHEVHCLAFRDRK